ncbi:hypothetical protein EZV73_23615 [Acidaminobacter sp. JC074]|uniref:hypothetical protein n=1 Tax=Acidaminobacter sp. JC074 TaxID=2530199 RepID=UPI001F0F0804|nr:hypothetical protein [Acidaminobacter sp. JC074]MCH4890590.1 hypothetical protein [Acidaminobacter sp. JC074]
MKKWLILVIVLLMVGCQSNTDEMTLKVNELQDQVSKLETTIIELEKENDLLANRVEELNARNSEEKIKDAIEELHEALAKAKEVNTQTSAEQVKDIIEELETMQSYVYPDLIELSNEEANMLRAFKVEYDPGVLIDASPLSICKLYLYSSSQKDFETCYELYIKDSEDIMGYVEKDEYLEIRNRDANFSYELFTDVYDLEVEIEDDEAIILWYAKDGYNDPLQGPFRYGFTLTKQDIWRVNFLPMQ